MTPTRKGFYPECSQCIFKTKNEDEYPCSKSHKEIRIASGEKLERNFIKCGLYVRNLEQLKVDTWNWSYVFGNIEQVKIIQFNSHIELEIATKNGNSRNINANKVFPLKKDLVNYLEKHKKALNLIKKYDLDVLKGFEDERT